jgi:hypothetical protein
MEAEKMSAYRVGDPHPTARPIQPGDIVINTSGWPGRLAVVDVHRGEGIAEVVGQAGVRIRCRLRDLVLASK